MVVFYTLITENEHSDIAINFKFITIIPIDNVLFIEKQTGSILIAFDQADGSTALPLWVQPIELHH